MTNSINLALEVGCFEIVSFGQMFESRLAFLEFALDKMISEVEEMMVGMEERKKGEQDVEGVKLGDTCNPARGG